MQTMKGQDVNQAADPRDEYDDAPVPKNEFAVATAPAGTAGMLAAQAREVAEMQTKFLMAERFPRDEAAAMGRVLAVFKRERMAEISSYEYAKGGSSISGLSIHAMQAIAQAWGNIEFGWSEVARGVDPSGVPFSEVRAIAVDLETRTFRPLQFIVRHWRDTRSGGYKLKDEREVYELCANMAQRRVRACLQAVIPRDVQENAEAQAGATLRSNVDMSPEGIERVVRAFEAIGVELGALNEFLQRDIKTARPAQIIKLKRVYQSLRDDMSDPGDWFKGYAPAETNDSLEAVRKRAAERKAAKGGGEKKNANQEGDNRDASTGQSHGAEGSASPTGRGSNDAPARGASPAPTPAPAPATATAAAPPKRTYAQYAELIRLATAPSDIELDMMAAADDLQPNLFDELTTLHRTKFGGKGKK